MLLASLKQTDSGFSVDVNGIEANMAGYSHAGSFDHEITGECGGLWFDRNRLVDYDGAFTLPRPVYEMLKAHGFDMSEVEETQSVEGMEQEAAV